MGSGQPNPAKSSLPPAPGHCFCKGLSHGPVPTGDASATGGKFLSLLLLFSPPKYHHKVFRLGKEVSPQFASMLG